MTNDEKAKAYDMALERAKKYFNPAYPLADKTLVEEIFPELRESEDERIRKELIEAFMCYDPESSWNGIPVRDIIAWLEKQKETSIDRLHKISTPASENWLEIQKQWEKEDEQKLVARKFTLDELIEQYNQGFNQGHLEGCTAGYNKAMKEMEQKEQKAAEGGSSEKPNNQWGEEDVKRLYSIGTQIGFLKGKYSEYQKDIDWLHALAEKMGFHKCKTGEIVTEWKKEDIDDKMLSKPKKEWSEEDEK